MYHRYFHVRLRWLALLACPLASAAQTQAALAPPAFKSAFEGYQPHTDDKTVNWKAANDTTARVGGWRAYAKEAAAAESAKPAQPSPSSKTRPEPAAAKP